MLNAFAPPFYLVASYFGFGFVYLLANLFLFSYLGNDFDDFTYKASLHCFLAGFMLNVIVGALYQLSSVIYEKAFCTLKGAFLLAFVQNFSLALVIFALFRADFTLLKIAVLLVFLCIFYFAILFLISFRIFKNISQISLYFAIIFLFFGVFCALILAFMLTSEYELVKNLHIYFMFGFTLFVCIGAASVLLPMFSLAHNYKNTLLYLSFGGYFFAYNKFLAIFSLLCFVLWCFYILCIRVRKSYDFWNLNIFFACLNAPFACVFYAINEYDLAIKLLIYAVILPFIIAHIYKILPFLIWYHFIAKFVGKTKVPLLNDLVLAKIAYFAIASHFGLVLSLGFFPEISRYFYMLLNILIFINLANFLKFIKEYK